MVGRLAGYQFMPVIKEGDYMYSGWSFALATGDQ
jgi:hypothetical protein